MLPPLNAWLAELFDRDNIDQTVDALIASRAGVDDPEPAGREQAKLRLADGQRRLVRLRTAFEAGADPAAREQRAAAQTESEIARPTRDTSTRAFD